MCNQCTPITLALCRDESINCKTRIITTQLATSHPLPKSIHPYPPFRRSHLFNPLRHQSNDALKRDFSPPRANLHTKYPPVKKHESVAKFARPKRLLMLPSARGQSIVSSATPPAKRSAWPATCPQGVVGHSGPRCGALERIWAASGSRPRGVALCIISTFVAEPVAAAVSERGGTVCGGGGQ